MGADYLPPFDTLPKALKFRGQQALACDMGVALAHAFLQAKDVGNGGKGSVDAPAEEPDCLIPVPVSARRLRERGYNQALLIARSLGKTLNVPVKARHLLKTLETGRQAELSASQRQDNLASAFVCVGDVEGLHVGLVDDVLTTGATLSVCEQTLLQAGAASVSRWVAFRTPEKPEPIEP